MKTPAGKTRGVLLLQQHIAFVYNTDDIAREFLGARASFLPQKRLEKRSFWRNIPINKADR